MTPLKRFGILCLDVLLFFCGVLLTMFLAASFLWPNQFAMLLVLFAGTSASMLVLFVRRQQFHRSQLGVDAERFLAARRAAALHPLRTKFWKRLERIALWLPSSLAAFVLLFFPQVSHLAHPRVDRLIRNQVHIPLNCTVLFTWSTPIDGSVVETICGERNPWPFGWHSPRVRPMDLSSITFHSISAAQVAESARENWPWRRFTGPEEVRELHSQGITLSCRQFRMAAENGRRTITCATTSPPQDWNFAAEYFGPPGDIPHFYQVIADFGPAQ